MVSRDKPNMDVSGGGKYSEGSSRRAMKPSLLILNGEVDSFNENGAGVNLRSETGDVIVPHDSGLYNEAFRKVLLYAVSDALDLTSEEEIWLSWKLGEVSLLLGSKKPVDVPLSVRQEILKGNYTKLLQNRRDHFNPSRSNASLYNVDNVNAGVDDWVDSVLSVFQTSYELSPYEELKIKGILVEIFTNLGVDNVDNPRGASYIPSDIKYQIFKKSFD